MYALFSATTPSVRQRDKLKINIMLVR